MLLQDQFFAKRTDSLDKLLMARKGMYEDEEHALRVMMTEQVSSGMKSKHLSLLV